MRKLVHILLLLATVSGSVTGMCSGRRVLCIGDDNHVAIEAAHDSCPAGSDGQGSQAQAADSETALPALTAAKTCVDHELPASAVDRPQSVNLREGPLALAPFLAVAPAAVAGLDAARDLGGAPPLDDLPAISLRCVRSVVLLL